MVPFALKDPGEEADPRADVGVPLFNDKEDEAPGPAKGEDAGPTIGLLIEVFPLPHRKFLRIG